MKKCLFFFGCYLTTLMTTNAFKAEEPVDCFQTGECDEYSQPLENEAINLVNFESINAHMRSATDSISVQDYKKFAANVSRD